ncbi:MAG TPA: molybdate ABC transporter substrate-binding protein [Nocardioides sp.]|uniref:molybdate ABC transporter substrate-binding protein n=1 Tax=Nocardioides sp. TaxID=35761 RepID=UPI002D80D966|nr:molybdate ABC transporter substrate-binding protein [Nocardioides sp.]HET6653064.1 molybdate ABC transporter substrate-binding protein [Nocardioides sp.]
MRLGVLPVLVPTTVLAALALTGCTEGGAGSSGSTDGGGLSGTLTVLAAASLTETFESLADEFESRHDGVTVELAFDSSATLAEQVNQGAPADVLATADERTMALVADAGNTADEPQTFATNRLVLVTPADNPAGIQDFADIDGDDVDFVVCVESAPCGALAAAVLDEQGIDRDPASEEVDVKAVLAKVELDEADAGIVYATDARAARDRVRAVEIPGSEGATTSYPIAVVGDAAEPELAEAWVDLVLSDDGQQALRDAGFGAP